MREAELTAGTSEGGQYAGGGVDGRAERAWLTDGGWPFFFIHEVTPRKAKAREDVADSRPGDE